ncbi:MULTISPECIES: Gfo/Idh/MocA family oxidoreductase [unclassified Mesorhizobium]|uniref:Gfo/Idh/MocA family protein n=1 Tax=unclassified Mesorhizobium TaxID=325217 RepID=UPI000FE77E91|nr:MULTISPECIES: Gfo/Idh/MocA family oxidoreductase [unclassified Mesorhizobium]RWB97644.1 MAG: Gfo/Idh/MocA family oxidoreductase [Mesorhizobium sp.]TGV22119.1 Gfo/Idh/MocA family oxidoreductase [Mesorhizobium sp. M4B.F.Ca.ET.143.01.1.1]
MRLLIVGTGGRANRHAIEFGKIAAVKIVGAVDVDPARLKTYAAKYNIEHTFASLEEAITWGQFDAAANVTSDRAHYPTTMALIAAGKHVLCEKPLAENYEQAREMATAAERAGLIGMVNFSFRDDAPLQRAREIVLSGEIGRVLHLDGSFLQSWLVCSNWRNEPESLWRLSTKHGSNGVLGDLGIHVLDCAAFAADSPIERVFARLKAFEKVRDNRVGEYELDANDSLAVTVELENGAIGVIQASRWATGYTNELKLRLFGDKGALEVLSTSEGSTLRACLGENVHSGVWREIAVEEMATNIYSCFVKAVETGENVEPGFRYAANLQRVVDLAIQTERQRIELGVRDAGTHQHEHLALILDGADASPYQKRSKPG